jgi:hypothetical protein
MLLRMLLEQIVESFAKKCLLRDARFHTQRLQSAFLRRRNKRGNGHEIHGLAMSRSGALLSGHRVRLTCLLQTYIKQV